MGTQPTQVDQYGSLEKDTPQKGVLIDFDGVHGNPVSVNKFTQMIPARYNNRSDPHWFRAHLQELQKLSAPNCVWQWSEIDVGKPLLEQAWRRDVIQRVDKQDRMWAVRVDAQKMISHFTNDGAELTPVSQAELLSYSERF